MIDSLCYTERVFDYVQIAKHQPNMLYSLRLVWRGLYLALSKAFSFEVRMNNSFQFTEQDSARFWSHVNKQGALWTNPETGEQSHCWEWMAARNPSGYGVFGIKRKPIKTNFLAHRAAWIMLHGDIPDGLLGCHKCDNPPCVNQSHLFLGTDVDNSHDAVKKNRTCSGQRHRSVTHPGSVKYGEEANNVKLTWSKVYEIRKLSAEGATLRFLAGKFDVTSATIFQIVHFQNWK